MERHLTTVVLALLIAAPAGGQEVILAAPGEAPYFGASSLDQPELYARLARDGVPIADVNGPVTLQAFMDTGATANVISYLNATGARDQGDLGLGPGDFVDEYEEIGLGGTEWGDVTVPLEVLVSNTTPMYGLPLDIIGNLTSFGEHGLWVRRAEGIGEVFVMDIGGWPLEIVDPVNILGMPIISQAVMAMDARTLVNDSPDPLLKLGRLQTALLPPGAPEIPQTNICLQVRMVDFGGEAPETLSTAANPMIRNVSAAHSGEAKTGQLEDEEWLFDTGSSCTFLSFNKAKQLGLVPDEPGLTFDGFMSSYEGPATIVGGIGPDVLRVPILTVDEIRVASTEGLVGDVVWRNVDVLVADLSGLEELGIGGIFGMNLLVPAITLDASMLDPNMIGGQFDPANGSDMTGLLDALMDFLDDLDPSDVLFKDIVFDSTDPADATLRLYSPLLPEHPGPGDADGDGDVDAFDYLAVKRHLGMVSGAGRPEGDFDDDQDVDRDDFLILAGHHSGAHGGTAAWTGAGKVPEPTTLALLALGACLPLLRRRAFCVRPPQR